MPFNIQLLAIFINRNSYDDQIYVGSWMTPDPWRTALTQ